MVWNLRWATDGWAIESGQYQRSTRGRLPDWYRNRPVQLRGDEFYLNAFHRLATCRQFTGTGMGPIPWDAAADYAARAGLSVPMQEVFVDVILILDQHYRQHLRDKGEQERRRQERAERRAAARASTKTSR